MKMVNHAEIYLDIHVQFETEPSLSVIRVSPIRHTDVREQAETGREIVLQNGSQVEASGPIGVVDCPEGMVRIAETEGISHARTHIHLGAERIESFPQ